MTPPPTPTQHTTEIDAVLKLRKRLQKEYEAAFSVNDVIIRSAALALRDVPEVIFGVLGGLTEDILGD